MISRDRMVKTSATETANWSLISCRVKPKTLKIGVNQVYLLVALLIVKVFTDFSAAVLIPDFPSISQKNNKSVFVVIFWYQFEQFLLKGGCKAKTVSIDKKTKRIMQTQKSLLSKTT